MTSPPDRARGERRDQNGRWPGRRRVSDEVGRLSLVAPLAVVALWLITGVAGMASAGAQEPGPGSWSADLEFLATQLEARHPDPYHSFPRERFREELGRLAARAPELSDDAMALGLARLLARLGDGHTQIPLLSDDRLDYRRLPVELVRTRDGLAVLAADSSLGALPGARVLRIGALPAGEALDSVATLVSRDNGWTAFTRAAEYAAVPEILHGLGISRSAESVRLLVEPPTGGRREVTLEGRGREAPVRWEYGAFSDAPPWLARRDDPYWLTVLPGDSVAYVQFNRADRDKEEESLAAFGRRLLGLVTEGSVRRIVLDLRWNRGGSRWRARHLLGALIAAEHAWGVPRSSRVRDPTGQLVTLIGPNTFSAATQFALDLELHTNTAFVGLPTGGKPNHFGEVGRFRLPESGLEVRHSVYYHQATHARDTRPAIFPDRRLSWSLEDVSAGRDPVFEAALTWRPLPPGVARLERRIREAGIDAGLEWLRALRRDPSPSYRVTEADLNRLGYELLGDGQPEQAAAIFQRNLEEHPWSANAHDSLADAYLELGRDKEAGRLLCRAFAIDPQFDRALEMGIDCQAAPESAPSRGLLSEAEIDAPQFFAVRVDDVRESARWYRALFGLEELGGSSAEDGSWEILNLSNERLFAEVVRDDRAQRVDRALGFYKVGFHVPDVRAVADRLEDRTGKRPRVLEFPEFGVRIIQIHDPDGHTIQLFSPLEEGAVRSGGGWWRVGEPVTRKGRGGPP